MKTQSTDMHRAQTKHKAQSTKHKRSSLCFGFLVSVFCLCFGFCVLCSNPAQAATYYVATNGNDSNSCAQAQNISTPKKTITNTLSCLSAGDTLYIRAGTYSESINSNVLAVPSGRSWDNSVLISNYSDEEVVLNPYSGTILNLAHSYIQYIEFDGITLDGINGVIYVVGITNGANHIRFRNCEIKNAAASGLIITNTSPRSDYNEIINCDIYDNGSSSLDHGFYIETSNNLVEYSRVYNNSGYGGHVYRSSCSDCANDNVVRYNEFYDNESGLVLSSGNNNQAYGNIVHGHGYDGIDIGYRADESLVYNNIIYDNNQGIAVSGSWSYATDNKIYNNTAYNNRAYGISIGYGADGTLITNNIAYANPSGNIRQDGTDTGTILSNNLTTNPLFVNAAGADFHLQSSSSAINAGYNLSSVFTTDFAGTSRPQGLAWDIGAYEYVFPGDTGVSDAPTIPANKRIIVVAQDGSGQYGDIQEAVDAAQPGDTIQIKNGVYANYQQYIIVTKSGTRQLPITLTNYPGHSPVIGGVGIRMQSSRWWIIENLEFSNNTNGIVIIPYPTAGLTDNITIRNNYIHDSGFQGILTSSVSNLLIENNIFERNGLGPGNCTSDIWGGLNYSHCHGIYTSDSTYCSGVTGITIRRNKFVGNSGSGWQNYSNCPNQATNFLVENNVFIDNLLGMYIWHLTGSIIRNNTIIETAYPKPQVDGRHGFSIYNNGNNTIANNVVYSTLERVADAYMPVYSWSLASNNQNFSHNAFFNKAEIDWVWGDNSPAMRSLVINFLGTYKIKTGDTDAILTAITGTENAPSFTDLSGGDYHLAFDSPLRDAGDAGLCSSTDFDGTLRSDGACDIGAYEYMPSIFYGDVSGDRQISAFDAALAARAAVGLDTLTEDQFRAADVDGGGDVSAYDAALIAQRAVGLIEKFPVEE